MRLARKELSKLNAARSLNSLLEEGRMRNHNHPTTECFPSRDCEKAAGRFAAGADHKKRWSTLRNAEDFDCSAGAKACCTAAQENPTQSGPTTLVIEYRCLPGQRAQLRQAASGALYQFAELKNNHVLASYHVLFSRYVNTNTWDMLAVLNFPTFADVTKWKAIERRTPAGLAADGLAATSAIFTYPADAVRGNATDSRAAHPVYLVIPYTISVPPPAYLQYVDDYVRPQFEELDTRRSSCRLRCFLAALCRVACPWDSLILLQYKDDGSLGLRETVVAKVRQELSKNLFDLEGVERQQAENSRGKGSGDRRRAGCGAVKGLPGQPTP